MKNKSICIIWMSFTTVNSSQRWGIGRDFRELHCRLHVCYFTCIIPLTGNWIPICFSISLFFHHRSLQRMLASYYRVALKLLVAHQLMYSVTVLWSVNNFFKTAKTHSNSWCKTRPRRLVFIRKSSLWSNSVSSNCPLSQNLSVWVIVWNSY